MVLTNGQADASPDLRRAFLAAGAAPTEIAGGGKGSCQEKSEAFPWSFPWKKKKLFKFR